MDENLDVKRESDLELANRALLKLGQRVIPSFDAQEETARTVKALYRAVLETELATYRWAFALKRAVLPADAKAPAFGFQRAYSLPDDFLRLEEINGLSDNARDKYAFEGGKILTDLEAPLKIIYITRNIDGVKWPAYFNQAFVCKLAFELCERLKQDPSRKNLLMQEYQLAIQNAKRSNAIQLPVMAAQVTPWEVYREF